MEEIGYERCYKIYVTDALKYIAGIDVRFVEMMNPPKEEDRTADEVIDGIRGKLKMLGESNESI